MTPFLKIHSAPTTHIKSFSADVPWTAPRPLRTLGDSLYATGSKLSTPNNFAPTTSTFKVAQEPHPPVNDVWKQTSIGNGKIISMAGANSDAQGRPVIPGTEAVPNWKNAFEPEPVGFIDFAHGYVSEMLGWVDLAQALLTHVNNTAVDMARHGEIMLGFPTPQKLLQDGGAVLAKAIGEPLVAAALDAASNPDRTINNTGDEVAEFSTDYKENLLNPYQTADTSFAAGVGTHILMTLGAKKFLESLLPDAKYAKGKVSELMDPQSYGKRLAANLADVVRNTPAATTESFLRNIQISRTFGNDRVTYTYSPALAPQAGEHHKPMYKNTPKEFSEHGIQATYNPSSKLLMVRVNTEKAEGVTGLNHALGDSGLMISSMMEALRIENRRVDTINLRSNVLQVPETTHKRAQSIENELKQLSAIPALEKEGYELQRFTGEHPYELHIVFHKKP